MSTLQSLPFQLPLLLHNFLEPCLCLPKPFSIAIDHGESDFTRCWGLDSMIGKISWNGAYKLECNCHDGAAGRGSACDDGGGHFLWELGVRWWQLRANRRLAESPDCPTLIHGSYLWKPCQGEKYSHPSILINQWFNVEGGKNQDMSESLISGGKVASMISSSVLESGFVSEWKTNKCQNMPRI